jgi:hypothetical protein
VGDAALVGVGARQLGRLSGALPFRGQLPEAFLQLGGALAGAPRLGRELIELGQGGGDGLVGPFELVEEGEGALVRQDGVTR